MDENKTEDLTRRLIHKDHNNLAVYARTSLPGAEKEEYVDGHIYDVEHDDPNTSPVDMFIGTVSFQRGPIKDHGVNGLTNEAMLAMLQHRLVHLDAKFPCEENKEAIEHIQKALAALERRTNDRLKRGVEGTNNK